MKPFFFKNKLRSFFSVASQIGSGTYSNVYKAIDVDSGRVVALKKVRVDGVGEAESARFMAREIALLRRLGDHPHIVRLQGLVTSRLNTAPSLYLVFEYMEHDLTGLTACATASGRRLSLPQVRSLLLLHTAPREHETMKCTSIIRRQLTDLSQFLEISCSVVFGGESACDKQYELQSFLSSDS